MANGNHSADHQDRGPFDAAVVEVPDSADRAKHNDQFHWLPDGTPASWEADSDFTSSDQPGAGQVGPDQADMGSAGTGQATAPPDVDALSAEPAVGEWGPAQDDVPSRPERTDFWATSVTAAPADLQSPTAPQDWIEEPKPAPTLTETAATPAAPATSELAQRLATDAAPSAVSTAAPPQVSAGPARFASAAGSGAAQPTSPKPADHGKDRFFPARLLVIIVIAALIGSALVLLLK